MELMVRMVDRMQAPNPRRAARASRRKTIGIFSVPVVPGGKGRRPTRSAASTAFLVTKTASKEAIDFLNFFSQEKYAKEAAEKGAYIPAYKAATRGEGTLLVKQLAAELAATTYHQNFFDQDLGLRSVGHHDVSVAVRQGR